MIERLRSKQFLGNRSVEKWLRLCMKVFHEVMNETVIDQLLDIIILTLSTTNEMIRLCNSRATLSDKDFKELRCVDSGSMYQFFFVLIGTGNQLTEELQTDPNYLAFNKQVALQTTHVNDIYSLRREIRDKSYRYNYVYVKIKNGNRTAQAAIDEIIVELNESERLARMYGEILKQRNDPNLSQYVDAMYDVMVGNNYWSSICKRYNSVI